MSLSMKMTCVLSGEECQLWAVKDWSNWNARNRLTHIGEQTHLLQFFEDGRRLLQDSHTTNIGVGTCSARCPDATRT
jgi:hypothetical protein